jgi:type I restriction enzyme S subunit
MSGKYQAYPEYKDSGVEWLGIIPESWRVLRGKFVFNEYSKRSESGDETLLSVSEYYGVKPRGDVIEEGDFMSRAESLIGYKKCEKNDLVMNIMLAWKRGLGVTKYDGIVSPAYSVFRFNEKASPDYMHYLLRTDTYTGHFKTRSTGVIDSRLRLYPDSFADVSILLPPITEQNNIAYFLDHETAKIDTLIEKQQQLIQLLKEKRQSVISHAVTKGLNRNAPMRDSGVEWLGDVPGHWEVKRLRFIADVQSGVAKGKDNSGLETIEVPYLRVANVQDGFLDLETVTTIEIPSSSLDRYRLRIGDVLMNEGGDFDKLGRGHIWNGEIDSCIHQNHVFAIRPKAVSSEWLNEITSSHYAQFYFITRSKQSTNLASISSTNIMELPVVLPPLREQQQILETVTKQRARFDTLTAKALRAIELLKERRTALISSAVTGKIDVRDWQAPGSFYNNQEINKEEAA